jgi:hypothetical protein
LRDAVLQRGRRRRSGQPLEVEEILIAAAVQRADYVAAITAPGVFWGASIE